MVATKEQERTALAQIKKIVESLGENSYIGIAFEGCFEIAEENIENDFACSMKQRYDEARHDADDFRRAGEYYAAEAEKTQKEVEVLKKKILTTAELSRVSYYVSLVGIVAEDRMKKEAELIVENAEDPKGNDFQSAVENNRRYKKMYEECKELNQRVKNCM